MKMTKVENWNGYEIRFVWHEDDWWGLASDIAQALKYSQVTNMLRKLNANQKGLHLMNTPGGNQEVSIVSEIGIYKLIIRSRRKEAEEFEQWVFETIRSLRQATGLEGFQVFRMLDKEHQKQAMSALRSGLKKPVRVDFIKANSITNKAVSSKFGYQKLVKKGDMTPDMLVARQEILSDTVDLMATRDRFNLNISVSDAIYSKHSH